MSGAPSNGAVQVALENFLKTQAEHGRLFDDRPCRVQLDAKGM